MQDHEVHAKGTVAPGFGPVKTAFERNLRDGKEVGAACAVYLNGEKVVDLWGGYRDRDRSVPWSEDTRLLMLSATKGVAAATMAHAQARGLFDWDAPVAKYWPAFARNGKAAITIRQLLDHQAGLAAIDGKLSPEQVADHEALMERLVAKAPD